MSRVLARAAAVAVFGLGLVALSAPADDPKPGEKKADVKKSDDAKPAEKKADDKKPDWSGYVSAGEAQGEVVSASDGGFTLRVFYTAVTGGNATRSRSRYMRPPTVSEKHTDYQLTYAESGMVRWRTLPPKGTDEKGKPVHYTDKERADLKRPAGATGYYAERGELMPGHLVEVTLLRPKTVSADKATQNDLRVKYAVIVGTDPKGAPADASKNGKKKGN